MSHSALGVTTWNSYSPLTNPAHKNNIETQHALIPILHALIHMLHDLIPILD
jgi:hypothetical protein